MNLRKQSCQKNRSPLHRSSFIIHCSKAFGFTLIELLVVISIIGILVSLGMASYSMIEKRGRDTKRKSDLMQLKTALEAYYAVNNAYPSSTGAWRGTCSTYGSHDTTGTDGYIPNLAPNFIEELPVDPRSGQAYPPCNNGGSNCYLYYSDGTDYKLLAHCGPESWPVTGAEACPGGCPENSPFCDPARKTWAWQVHSSSTSICW